MANGDEDNGVRVTLKLVYDAVTKVQSDVTELKQTAALNKLAADLETKQVADHEVRLRNVERWLYAIPATLLAAIVSSVVAFVK